jgi:valyl-tRNA synthetase
MELSSRYNPQEVEDKWYKFWEENNLFSAKPNSAKKPFCIVIPPPNITGILHMGHALNNTIQDILIRYNRMRGEESLWMPGTDHAGIATQNVVEKSLAQEDLKRQDLGREKFIERVRKWKEEYGSTIIRQLKKLGASCDWERTRFTMDEEYSQAVIEVFVRLYEKGLIYQGNYIINWCPRCQTALSDEEAPHQEVKGSLYHIKYPVKPQTPNRSPLTANRSPLTEFITVATTRPETMLGDTAVAVNPKDRRYKKFIGQTLVLPLVNREIKVIADNMVDMEFGTGAVKVTPAHDPNDYILGKKHNLEFINVMYPNGQMNENAGKFNGLDRFKCREDVLEELKNLGLLEKVQPHTHAVGHCYRCHTVVEPYLSKQWFVKMKPLAKPAIETVKKGRIKFYPQRWTKVYLNWMENIQDWCISRQIWWGHRIPVYYCRKCREEGLAVSGERSAAKTANRKPITETGVIVSKVKPEKCPACGSNDIYQDEDVLDTWFSSWLWPFAIFYRPNVTKTANRSPQTEAELKYFYPTSVLVTAQEIIFFWVARMIMAGLEFMKDIPFRDVYIHGTVRDLTGKKMSKSLGNIIDPLEIINEFGADALRFTIISITAVGQDIFLSEEKFHLGRNFANKIWNASRFILMNLKPEQVRTDLCQFFKKEDLDIINRWILSRFYSLLKELSSALEAYRFNEAAGLLYQFFWHEFCDWYLEIIKPEVKNPHNQVVMYKILEKFLRVLHPFMPFITEEIWQRLPHEGNSIMIQTWPHIQEEMLDKKLEKQIESVFALITQIRNLRQELELKPEQKVKVSVYPHDRTKEKLLQDKSGLIANLARLESLELLKAHKRPSATISTVIEEMDIYLHLTGIVDVAKEQTRIKEKIANISKLKDDTWGKLQNKDFLKRAPPDIVEKEKERLTKFESEINRLEKMFNEFA